MRSSWARFISRSNIRLMRPIQPAPSKRTLRALDAVNFLMADVHTGVGPFVAIYLAASLHWDPKDIGVALSAAAIAGLVAPAPGGALIPMLRYQRGEPAVGPA